MSAKRGTSAGREADIEMIMLKTTSKTMMAVDEDSEGDDVG